MSYNKGEYHEVKFSVISAGHEINSFFSALIEISGLSPRFKANLLKRIQNIKKPVNIKVFVQLGFLLRLSQCKMHFV